jgi:hypothetical protein
MEENRAAVALARRALSRGGRLVGVIAEGGGLGFTEDSARYYAMSLLGRGADGSLDRANSLKAANRLSYAELWLKILGLPAPKRRGALGGHEVGEVMDPLGRPAGVADVGDDILGVADQVTATPIVLEVVIAAEAADVDERILGRWIGQYAGGAVHPGQRDVGLEVADRAPQYPRRAEIEPPAERNLKSLDPALGKFGRAGGVGADDDALFKPSAPEREHEADEERFGPAVLGSRHRLKDAHDSTPEGAVSMVPCSMEFPV